MLDNLNYFFHTLKQENVHIISLTVPNIIAVANCSFNNKEISNCELIRTKKKSNVFALNFKCVDKVLSKS